MILNRNLFDSIEDEIMEMLELENPTKKEDKVKIDIFKFWLFIKLFNEFRSSLELDKVKKSKLKKLIWKWISLKSNPYYKRLSIFMKMIKILKILKILISFKIIYFN